MAIDWKKELDLSKRIYFWYMKGGLIALPFAILFATLKVFYHVDNKWVLFAVLASAVVTNFIIQGMPPEE